MVDVEFCLMFYRFYDASSYQKVISWNLHASTDRFAKSPPDLRPNISCGQSKISRVGREGNADELVKNQWSIHFFSGFWFFSSKKPCFLMTRICSSEKPSLLQHIPSMKCTENCDQILAWIMAEWPRAPSLSFHFLHFSSPKTVAKNNVAASQRRIWYGLLAFNLAHSLRLRVSVCQGWTMLQSHESETAEIFCLDVANFFFRQNFRIHWLVFFRLPIWENLGKSTKNLSTTFRICFTQVVKIVVLLSLGSRGLKPHLFKNHISF